MCRPEEQSASQGCDVGDAGNVLEDVLGKNRGQTRQDLFRFPTLTLKIDNVRLKEDGTAIAKLGHSPARKAVSAKSSMRIPNPSAAACRK